MKKVESFRSNLFKIAVPVTLQSLMQASFSVVDQIMTGQLGSVSIAGIGLGGKFSSLFSVMITAVAAAAGIMIAQFIGKNNIREVGRSFYMNLFTSLLLAVLFTALTGLFPVRIMGLYTKDGAVSQAAADYLRILSVSFVPIAAGTLLSTLLRCIQAAAIPLYAGIAAALLNTGLNYILIFGKLGFPAMGVKGAAIGTVTAQVFSLLVLMFCFLRITKRKSWHMPFAAGFKGEAGRQYAGILFPLLVCEFFWSLGENLYASVYGHMGTNPCAAMTLTAPIQGLTIGALSGLSQAAGIMTGKSLGAGDYNRAYEDSKKLMLYGLAGSLVLSLGLTAFSGYYVKLYQVEADVRITARMILLAFALVAPFKVQNMILGGGIIRSGGKTNYIMVIDFIGTWLFGVPLGFLSAFVWKQPIPYVYFILSLEECVRFALTLLLFKRKSWMNSLKQQTSP